MSNVREEVGTLEQRAEQALVATKASALAAWHKHVLMGSAGALALAVAIAVIFAALSFFTRHHENVGVATEAAPAKEVRHEEKVDVAAPPKLKAYKPAVKKQLGLPQKIVDDDNQQAVATARAEPSARPHTFTAVTDIKTGETKIMDRADPYPWVAFDHSGEVSIAGGYKYSPVSHAIAPVARFQVQQDFLQVKALHAGVVGTLDTDGAWFVGARIAYRW